MKLKNKKTGEIKVIHISTFDGYFEKHPTSLAELNEEWEDVPEEPKEYWCIDWTGGINHITVLDGVDEYEENKKEIGNYFATKEEAEKAVEKLKAWKRLRDDGLKIKEYELNGGTDRNGCFTGDICLKLDISKPVYEDILQLLFGGEE